MFDKLQAQRKQQEGKQEPLKESSVAMVALERIQVAEQRTRPLNPEHVQELLDSIAVVGLGQPLITDRLYHLIAGGHRLAAIQRLQAEQPHIFQQHFQNGLIPIRVYEFDALAEPDRAEQIEIAENEKRRDYTSGEIKALAQKYIEQGYTPVKGRPKKGEKPLIPALANYFRVSRRTIQNYLYGEDDSESGTQTESAKAFALSPKAKKIKGYLKSAQQLRGFLAREKMKGVRSLDNIIQQLEEHLNDEIF